MWSVCSRLRFQRLLLTASRAFSDQSLLLPLSATIPCGKTETEIRVQTQLPSGKYFTPCDTNEYSFATDGESRSFCDSPYKIEFIGKNRTRHSVEMGEGRYLGMLLLVECVYCACQHFLLHRFFFFSVLAHLCVIWCHLFNDESRSQWDRPTTPCQMVIKIKKKNKNPRTTVFMVECSGGKRQSEIARMIFMNRSYF